ncbi:nucleotidyltransferase family protein [Pelagibacterales bacterium SAG-MED25]|uniref:nucleotidyltransferase family protein n=1 Tax=Pelagibacter sp. (strain HTCC7211) TaxID=439493 RepID=UPI000554ADB0|nr:nucleotidyltransferase family protein [Candidatus Pelagibacter sp. HTCC7211]MBD1151171.1 nucleotidyltransferase family protein [Pelagibacterales bacterium SAG-MED25]
MKAILLCAGKGMRLRPYTNNTPKCLMPIKGIPLLEIWLDKLSNAGISDFLINTHYLSEKVNDYINTSKYKKSIKVVYEKELLGTAGTLLNNISFFDEQDGFFIHADNYTLDDLKDFINFHINRPKSCQLSMMTFETDTPSTCGIIKKNNKNIVTKFYEKMNKNYGNEANSAVYILSKEFLKIFFEKFPESYDFSKEVLGSMENKIAAYKTDKLFIDIGTVKNYNLVK